MNEVAYWAPPEENPNFISRPPDPGLIDTFKTVGWEALYHSPFNATKRWSELSLAKNIPDENFPTRKWSPDELNEKYGLGGQLKFDEPMYPAAAEIMMRRKIDENDRSYLIASGNNTGMRKTASFGVGMASTLLDPINVAAIFIPVAGEARIARFAEQFGGSALKQRLIKGALTGASGAAMVEPFVLLPALQEQANYDLKDSALNLGFGAAFGGMLHAGLGAIGDRLRRVPPRDADAIFESAMNNVLKDEPVSSPGKIAEFVDELNPERIQAAAIKMEDGTILSGRTHANIAGEQLGDVPMSILDKAQDGFLTDTGRFVDRYEAASLAQQSGQAHPENADVPLAAEHLEFQGEQDRQNFLEKQNLNDLGIPRRDPNGRFLSKEARLELLNQKLQDDAIAKAREMRGNGDKKVIEDTKENSSRLTSEDKGMTGVTSDDTRMIDEHTAELEKSLDLTPQQLETVRSDLKEDVGDVRGRETGIIEGIKCIIRNLI